MKHWKTKKARNYLFTKISGLLTVWKDNNNNNNNNNNNPLALWDNIVDTYYHVVVIQWSWLPMLINKVELLFLLLVKLTECMYWCNTIPSMSECTGLYFSEGEYVCINL